MTRPADKSSPDGTLRPYWMLEPLKPAPEFYRLGGEVRFAELELPGTSRLHWQTQLDYE
jgi:hypothetical protein